MGNKRFFIDDATGQQIDYAQLVADVQQVDRLPPVVAMSSAYTLYQHLLAAFASDARVILVDDASLVPTAEQTAAEQATAERNDPRSAQRLTQRGGLPWSKVADANNAQTIYQWLAASDCRMGLFTSGTTGRPKLVQHSPATLLRAVRTGPRYQAHVWGLAYHPAHFAGLQVFFQAVCNANPLVQLYGHDADTQHDAIERHAITHLSGTPTLMRLLAGSGRVHARVHSITLGGEAADPILLEQLKAVFPQAKLRNVYASTEVGSLLACDGELFRVPEQLRGLIDVMDGELVVHRSLLADSLQATVADEFYRTGDCVQVVDAQPLTFRFLSRRSDFINVGGFKVNPHEVEQRLRQMPEVLEAVVYGTANSVTGNLVSCDLVLKAEAQLTVAELRRRLSGELADYEIPRFVRIVADLPQTATGKRMRGL